MIQLYQINFSGRFSGVVSEAEGTQVVSNVEGKRRSIHLSPASGMQTTSTDDKRVAEQQN
jgi:hypothetical protein